MQALILVGGQGTRLRPLTNFVPKAMVPILNVPFLEHVIEHLKKHEITDIILTRGQLCQPVENYFGDGSSFGVKLNYLIEENPLGTAGAVKNAAHLLKDTFLVLNGDIFTDLDLGELVRQHRRHRAVATIALTPVDDPTSYGVIETTSENRVTAFIEKPPPERVTTNMINAGIYVLEPAVLGEIPAGTNYSFERQLFPYLLRQGKPVYAFPSSDYWIDIGNPQKYAELNRRLLSGKGGKHGFHHGDEVIVGEGSQVHPTARIAGPVLIGNNCIISAGVIVIGPTAIGPDCHVGDGATVAQSILWSGVRLDPGAYVADSIIACPGHLGPASILSGAVLGFGSVSGEGQLNSPKERTTAQKISKKGRLEKACRN